MPPQTQTTKAPYRGAMLGLVTGSVGAVAYGAVLLPCIVDACML